MAGKQLTAEQRQARFWQYVDKTTTPEGCWTWIGYRMPRGYGNFQSRDPRIGRLAHRYAYDTFVTRIPDGLEVMHTCDTPSCVRPNHLSVGTQKDNMEDAVTKARVSRGEAHAMTIANRGRRLTPDQVHAIRRALDEAANCDHAIRRSLAIQYGVTFSMICQIGRRRAWRYLPEERTQ